VTCRLAWGDVWVIVAIKELREERSPEKYGLKNYRPKQKWGRAIQSPCPKILPSSGAGRSVFGGQNYP
jgi:hypothetical protein